MELVRLLRADPGQQCQDPLAGDRVAGVFGQAEKGQQVLDVSRLDELQPAVLGMGQALPGQLPFQQHAVMGPRNSTACCARGMPWRR